MKECPYCNKVTDPGKGECLCGFPAGGTREQKYQFLFGKSMTLKSQMEKSAKGVHNSQIAIFTAAGVALLNSVLLLAGIFHTSAPEHQTTAVVLTAVVGVCFVALGFLHRKSPLPISVAGLLLSVVFFRTSIVGLVLIVLLGYGVWCAAVNLRAKRRYAALQRLLSEYAE